ncbi:MAG: beta-ketoacyl-[acyl-carrier-protein] synthase family protein [Planctomycetota bacterium]|jgi:3-oxoacyl-[acyl-carrier-protein] synthase II
MSSTDKNRRIVITGMGWITPLGHDLESVWTRLVAGESGAGPIERFDARTFPTTFAASVRNYDYRTYVDDPKIHANAGEHTQFALGAARQAWQQSGLGDFADLERRRVGLYLGAGEGALDFQNYARTDVASWDSEQDKADLGRWYRAGQHFLRSMNEVEQEPNMPLAHIAREFGLRGPASNCLTACAASTQAVGEACSLIRRGDADVMVSGGTHTMIHVLGVTGFNRLTALSTNDGDPKKASRPFDRNRDGFVMGEGAGIVILEALDHAEKRGATPIAEVAGFGSSADAFRITDMHPEGAGPASAILQALTQAGIDPADTDAEGNPTIDYISAHGTGTQENDSIETRAIKRVFGDLAPRIPVSSVKSMMGHLIAAAGAVELIVCTLAIQNQVLPPTINLNEPDPDLDLDYIPNEARYTSVKTCLSNSFGFGGQNDTLVVRAM